jgi:phage terminase large subunit-like protein
VVKSLARKPPSFGEAIDSFSAQLISSSHKPTIGKYKPMPMQEIFHKTQTKHRVVRGGNRGGKTFSSVADDVLVQLHRHPHRQHLYPDRPLHGRFIGVDFERGVEQGAIPLFQQFIPPSALRNGSWEDSYRPSEHILHLAPEYGKISFMSYEQDPNKFQIVALDWVHFDEEPPIPIFKESQLRVLDSGGTITISMTPVQQMEWLQDQIIEPAIEGLLPTWSVIDLDTRDNIHLNAEAVTELSETLSAAEKKVRFEGQYTGGSLVFPKFTRKYPHVIPDHPLERYRPELGWAIYEGMDYGYANPTAWLWIAVHRDGSVVVIHEEYEDHVIVSEWARRVHAFRNRLRAAFGDPEWMPEGTFGDPAIGQENNGITGLTIQQAYAELGIGIATGGIVKARAANQNFGLNRIRTYLEPRPAEAGPAASNGDEQMPWLQVAEGCQFLIGEVRKARKPKQTLKQAEVKNVGEEIRDKDNHAIDALKYLCMSLPDLRPLRFQTVEVEQAIPGFVREMLRPQPTSMHTHDEAWYAANSTDIHDGRSSSYSSLEG